MVIGYNPSESARRFYLPYSLGRVMTSPRLAVLRLVHVALLLSVTGCGTYSTIKSPQPVIPNSTNTALVATTGLRLGYVWQAASSNLYPILGVTGAAHYGNAALPGGPKVVQAAAITTASGAWALTLDANGALRQWDLAGQTSVVLSTNIPIDSQIWISPSGSSAAVISPSSATGAVISGLPTKAQVAGVALPLGIVLPDVAVSDTGALLVGVTRGSATATEVGVVSTTRTYTPVTSLQAWGGAAFAPGQSSDAAVIADGSTAQAVLVSQLTSGAPVLSTIVSGELLQRAAGVAVSADARWAYIGDSGKPQIVRASLSGSGSPTAIACACTPQQMIPLTSDGVFSLTRNSAGQADWILDTRAATPRSFFVPANPASSQSATIHRAKLSERVQP